MPSVLFVSKPLIPPWNDSGKNLARDLAAGGARYHYHAMIPRGAAPPPGARGEEVYGHTGPGFAVSYAEKARVLGRIWKGGHDLYHFFFAPNPASSAAATLVTKARGLPSVQTLCSAPRPEERVAPWLFGRRVVVLSQHTKARLLAEGVDARRVVYIPPALVPPELPSAERVRAAREKISAGDRPIHLFPGDYEVSQAAETFARAIVAWREEEHGPRPLFVFACRAKTPHAAAKEAEIRRIIAPCEADVRFAGEVPDILALLAAAQVVALPAESLYAKMDAPLVLLEAMSFAIPVVVASVPPISELLDGAACGLGVPPAAPEVLTLALSKLARDPGMRARFGAEGKQLVQSTYTARTVAARYEDLYDEVLREAGPRRSFWS